MRIGRTLLPAPMRWPPGRLSPWRASCRADRNRCWRSSAKLRAKGAGRVVELLLGDDAISPATAAKAAGLSDRASRRLFDRLVELGAVRELSGRANFRLYGL